ncbi:MAG: HEAT repeat domain-containing protein [Pirellulales bacterium]|nr:HEAT repeat domain-containing protein [Pirellulales bacterium]
MNDRVMGRIASAVVFLAWSMLVAPLDAEEPRLELRPHDRIALVGNSLAERMRLYGNFEALLHTRFPEHELVVRNFGWPCDEVGRQQRPNDYTALDDPLAVFAPDVLLCFYGFNESFAGPEGLPKFKADLAAYVQRLREQFAKDGKPPRIVLASPIAYEATGDPLLPDGVRENEDLKLYAEAIANYAKTADLLYCDLFTPTLKKFDRERRPDRKLTINGVHLNDRGDRYVSFALSNELFGRHPALTPQRADDEEGLENPRDSIVAFRTILERMKAVRTAVVDLQWHHQQDYRMVNGWYVYGSRSKPLDVETFRPEYAKIRKMCAERDRVIWALARGQEPPAIDDAHPELDVPPTAFGTKPYSEPEELRILTPAEAEAAMTTAPGYKIQTFASEEMFPELAKPVQMAFDNRGRLWVSCMPTYPQWRPGDPQPTDRLLILEDADADGRADKTTVFATGLHVPVGFEFWNGGVLVTSQPKLLFLKDTDGDDRADVREAVLDGFATDDTHHAISAFEWTPDGRLVMLEGISMSTTVETPWGPFRNHNVSNAYALDPRRWRMEHHVTPCFANPWCYTHNQWGQGFVGDGTGADQHWATPLNGAMFDQRKSNRQFIHYDGPTMRPALGNGFLYSRHFPPDAQGNFFYACVINMNGILQFKVADDGSGYTGARVEDLVRSTDKNFRPGDPQIGPDGALYFIDWHNPLIGHMQYSQRDPNRDHSHGRVYRLYAEGRPLVKAATQADKSVTELLEQLREYEAATRYRVQRELRDRPRDEVIAAVKEWVGSLAANDPLRERLMIEGMWALAGQHAADRELLAALLKAEEPNARAAAVHIIADLREFVPDALDLIGPLVDDPHPRVRLEAVRAFSFFPTEDSVELALKALQAPLDEELTYTLESTLGALQPAWSEARASGRQFAGGDPAAGAFLERVAAAGDVGREVNALVKSIIERYDHEGHRTTVMSRLNALGGHADEGAKVFQRTCRACHRVGDDGADFGPNLSDVGKRLRRDEIFEALVFPNKKIDPKYRATNIVTVDGRAFSGLLAEENQQHLSLVLGDGKMEKIPVADVEIRQTVEVSSMPERLNESMSGVELLDLLAFLSLQQTTPEPAPAAGQ